MPARGFIRNAFASEASVLRARGPVDGSERSVSITQLSSQRRTGFLIVHHSFSSRRTLQSRSAAAPAGPFLEARRHANSSSNIQANMGMLYVILITLLCCSLAHCRGACAEPDSDTEAVAGQGFKLGCLSCKRRSEVQATATVEWHFRGKGEADFYRIYTYTEEGPNIESDNFMDRVDWNGSKRSNDIQDASIYLLNVTFNDSGTYQCFFNRILFYDNYEYSTVVSKVVHLTVVAKATRGTASIVSEVMMYVSIIGLQVWLLIEMIYCYRKISAAGEEALREAANAEYLAIASEGKDNCAGVQVGE